MRILLVDDHPITRAALSSLLEGHGFSVAGEAADGAEAIEVARRLRPDLVLLDLSMPGWTAYRRCRASARQRRRRRSSS
jgi:CheY-like chemotaxis protein